MKFFILGNIAMACFVAGLFFLKFWRQSRDRLFIMFASAFWIFAVSRLFMAFSSVPHEFNIYVSLTRIAAFLLILFAILDKNRRPKKE